MMCLEYVPLKCIIYVYAYVSIIFSIPFFSEYCRLTKDCVE